MKRIISGAILLSLAGCGTAAFSPHFRDNNLADLRRATAQVASPKALTPINHLGQPLAFLVTESPTQVVAYDLHKHRPLWAVKGAVTSRIVVGTHRIFYLGDKMTLIARAIDDGRQLWQTPIKQGDRLLGLATDGEDLYCVTELLKRSSGGPIAFLTAIKGQTGTNRWVRPSTGRLGAPEAFGGRVFVPFRSQSLSILDAADGIELARIRSKKEMVLWVRKSAGGILFGGKHGVYKLDAKATSGTPETSNFISTGLAKAIQTVYWWDGYNAALADYTAYDRKRLLWQVAPQKFDFLDDSLFVHYYRFFFAFNTADQTKNGTARLKWAYSIPRHDAVASVYTGGAIILFTDNGVLEVLDPRSGRPVLKKELKYTVRGASFDAAGYSPPGTASQEAADLRRSLTEVIWDPDRRFESIKLFSVDQLAQLPGSKVTKDLLKIIIMDNADPAVSRRAGTAIINRHDKGAIGLYLQTLKSRYSFIEASQAQGVDIMAQALGDLKAVEAVRPLLFHFADHETSLAALEQIAKALSQIGHRSVLEPFRDFLLTYRCDPDFNQTPEVLKVVAKTLLVIGGENERQLLTFVGNDPHTLAPLQTYLNEILRHPPTEKASKN